MLFSSEYPITKHVALSSSMDVDSLLTSVSVASSLSFRCINTDILYLENTGLRIFQINFKLKLVNCLTVSDLILSKLLTCMHYQAHTRISDSIP